MSDVLIVDDNDDFRKLVRTMLRGSGIIDINDVYSAAECLLLLIKDPPKVLILDINMPFITGLDILDAVKQNKWLDNVHVIIITGSDFVGSSTSVRRGAVDYFLKPITESKKFTALVKYYLELEQFKESQ